MNASLEQALRALPGVTWSEAGALACLTPTSAGALSAVLSALHAHGGQVGRDLTLSRAGLKRTGAVDAKSLIAEVEAGVLLGSLEDSLSAAGFTLGPLSPRTLERTLAEFLEGPSAGLRAIPGGRLEPLCVSLAAVLADGTRVQSAPAPRSAVGPDLDAVFLGGGGRAGLVVAATVRLFLRPQVRRAVAFSFPTQPPALEVLSRAAGAGAWIARAHLAARGRGAMLSAELWGTQEGAARDVRTLEVLAAAAGGEPDEARLPTAQEGPEAPLSYRGLLEAIGQGRALTLHRVSVEGALVSGLAAVPAAAAPWWSALVEELDPAHVLGGAL